MSITKGGILKSLSINESSGRNLVIESNRNSSYSYTPGTGTNSTVDGYDVDLSSCKSGDILYIRIRVDYNGLNASNTSGTFGIWFQGTSYNSSEGWNWNHGNIITEALGDITSIVSGNNGCTILHKSVTVSSSIPETYSKVRVGLRSDYSNGTGSIRISELEVIPSKYYVPETPTSNIPSFHLGKEYVSAREIYEF